MPEDPLTHFTALGDLADLADRIDVAQAAHVRGVLDTATWQEPGAAAIAVLLCTAYPSFVPLAMGDRALFERLFAKGCSTARTRAFYLRRLGKATGLERIDEHNPAPEHEVRGTLRRMVAEEKIRIALRELLPLRFGGPDVNVTAREVSDLAEASLEVAYLEAEAYVTQRFGPPHRADGLRSHFAVLGMGKLGGSELNVGSDIDLLFIYDTDEGSADSALSLHEFWSRVARRLVATLEEATEEGAAWRVDLRLRPEGSVGALVNSVAAAERYYEGWGRPWERAALLRARPVAGDLELGHALLNELMPFVYRRRVDPSITLELQRMLLRSREELCRDVKRDLKLGPGGIREAEFFVQALQLIWGGQEPSVRVTNTLAALQRLRARGLVTDRESRQISDAYLLLRRLEHRVQWGTGLQTHDLPDDPQIMLRLARSLGYTTREALASDLEQSRAQIRLCFESLIPNTSSVNSFADLVARIAADDEAGACALLQPLLPAPAVSDLARELFALAKRPDDPLGAATAERFPEFGPAFVKSIVEAANPELAARMFRATLARTIAPAVYVRTLAEDTQAMRRLAVVFGASFFVGSAVVQHPELRDRVLLTHRIPTPEQAAAELRNDASQALDTATDDPEHFVSVLRAAKLRTTVDVALADLAGELDAREATRILAAIADATLEATTRFVCGETPRGFAILALGKLGGYEVGYGSDLDVIFLYDPANAPADVDPNEHFARRAQRVIRLVSMPHSEGPGYELDTRLRPSGSQGMLVTSLTSFARYHGVEIAKNGQLVGSIPGTSAAAWERQALIRARFAAGDTELGAQATAIAEKAAYESGAPNPEELHRLRHRMERELGREKPGRYDLKVGNGGLVDIEFAIQYLQMLHGKDPRVRTTDTLQAISALTSLGHLSSHRADIFLEGYRFLRRLEQRIRIVHATTSYLLDERTEGLDRLARRMGLRQRAGASAAQALMALYRDKTEQVRKAYCDSLGLAFSTTTPLPIGVSPLGLSKA